ncbi:MAG: hypothetical protein DRJ33_04985 [Candidatus Methanomethylicota archaeon]|uniref:Uncharacterized protein n=1 Tax=Thermoproteota archaeon TaxID=2056631 RepID=A0A497EXC9_9CREN|nr:MAG: hypothetical protein DRJ33_04985 [Candidatus Verstraetearchaeota archaeon]
MKLYYQRFDRALKEVIGKLEEGKVEEAKLKLVETLNSYIYRSKIYPDGERFERSLYNRFRYNYVSFKSEHSFGGVDIVLLGKVPKVKLVECKISRSDIFHIEPEDYEKLHDRYHQLKNRGYDVTPIIAIKFPHRRRVRYVVLKDEWMDKEVTLRVEYRAKSRRVLVSVARSRRKKYERKTKFEKLQAERLMLIERPAQVNEDLKERSI